MKRLALTGLLFLLVLPVTAQKNQFFLALSGGPSFPVGDYASASLQNQEAGLAKTGYNLNLNFGYQIQKNWGIASNILYTKHGLDQDAIHEIDPGLSGDHWQYYGITVGPMVTTSNSTEKIHFDFKILFGVTTVNMPVLSYQTVSSEEKWASAFTTQLGADMRYNFSPKTFFIANADYTAMKPKTTLAGADVEQKMSAIDINVGIGVRF